MKFNIDKAVLAGVLNSIKGGLGTVSIGATCVKIVAEDDNVYFYTNNYKVGYSAVAKNVNVDENGTVLVDGESLLRYAGAARNSELEFVFEEGTTRLTLVDGRRNVNLGIIAESDFADPVMGDDEVATVNLATLKDVLKLVVDSAATNGSIQDGIFISSDFAVGLDGHKATICPFASSLENAVLLPRSAAKEIMKLVFDGDCIIKVRDNFWSLEMESASDFLGLSFSLLNADEYPPVERFREKEYEQYVEVPLGELHTELEYASLVSSNADQLTTLHIDTENTNIGIEGDAYMGLNKSQTDVEYDGLGSNLEEDISIGFQVHSLRLLTKAAIDHAGAGSSIKISILDNVRPVKLECGDLEMYLSPSRRE